MLESEFFTISSPGSLRKYKNLYLTKKVKYFVMSKPNTRAIIDANIRQNGQQLITGQVLNATLNAMVTDYAEQAALDGLKEKVDALALGAFYGYFPDSASLPADVTTPGYAYVGSDNPYEIWNFNGESWSDSGTSIDMNDADEEDITRNADGKLQFKDRSYGDGMGYVILRKDKTFAEQVSQANTIYEIRYDFDLGGEEVEIPNNCVLYFIGGSLVNGTIAGDIQIYGNGKGSLMCDILGSIISPFNLYNYGSHTKSLIESCKDVIYLQEDVNCNGATMLSCDFIGNGHVVTGVANTRSVFEINADNVHISNTHIVKELPIEDSPSHRYAVHCNGFNNLSIENCEVEGAIMINSEDAAEPYQISYNAIIKDNHIHCDFTSIGEGGYYERDVISILGIQGVEISNNRIDAKNVNRIFKFSASNLKGDYDSPSCYSGYILVENNVINAESNYGKQVFDNFCGTLNVKIVNNRFTIKGFGHWIQDKTTALTDKKTIEASNNYVDIQNACIIEAWANKSCANYILSNNNIICHGDNTNRQITTQGGQETIVTIQTPIINNGCESMLIENNNIEAYDSYVGLNLCVSYSSYETGRLFFVNNYIKDFNRIAIDSHTISYFKYRGNVKYYTSGNAADKMEVNLQSSANVNVVDCEIVTNNTSLVPVVFQNACVVGVLNYVSASYLTRDRNKRVLTFGSATISQIISSQDLIVMSGNIIHTFRVGTSNYRPILDSSVTGFSYFESNTGKPVWWNGSKWVDATGADA